MVSAAIKEREQVGFKAYSPLQMRILVNEAVRTLYHHEGQNRHSGEPYTDHLFRTAMNLIQDMGITGLASLIASLKHDAVEDKGIKFDHLVKPDEYGLLFDEKIAELQRDVATIVRAVTKIRKQDPEGNVDRTATDEATFAHLLKVMRDFNLRPAYIKLADRTDNADDIKTHKDPVRQSAIIEQTRSVYVRLAEVLRTGKVVDRLLNACLAFENPELAKDLDTLFCQRHKKRLSPYKDGILEAFHGRQRDRSTKRFLSQWLDRIEFPPSRLLRYLPRDRRSFRGITLDDLDIDPFDPLFEITVITEPCAPIADIIGHIEKRFGIKGRDGEYHIPDESEVPSQGALVPIHAPEFGGDLFFRIIDCQAHARAKRGLLAGGKKGKEEQITRGEKEETEILQGAIDKVLKKPSPIGRPPSIIRRAQETLLRPTISVYTPDRELKILPQNATVLDFAAGVHSGLLKGISGARAYAQRFSRGVGGERLGIFDELKDGAMVRITQTCDAPPLDPGAISLVKTENARTVIRRILRARNNEEVRGKEYTEKIRRLFGISETQFLFALWIRDETGRKIFAQEIFALNRAHSAETEPAGKTPKMEKKKKIGDIILELLCQEGMQELSDEEKKGVPRQMFLLPSEWESTVTSACKKLEGAIGNGSVEVLQPLAERIFQNVTKWQVEAVLPNQPAVLKRIGDEFGKQGINIDHPIESIRPAESEYLIFRFTAWDRDGTKSVSDMMQTFLKLSYEYDLSVKPYEAAPIRQPAGSSG
ncbi:HD domain-containing protein [Candidatus Peregrinibacteria bacterium]|nr:HD domain-containing protein [Candidatus Peregrinibacteria bacterium]